MSAFSGESRDNLLGIRVRKQLTVVMSSTRIRRSRSGVPIPAFRITAFCQHRATHILVTGVAIGHGKGNLTLWPMAAKIAAVPPALMSHRQDARRLQ